MKHLKQLVESLNESSLNLHWVKDLGGIYRIYYNTTSLAHCWKCSGPGYATLCGNSFSLLKDAQKETVVCLKNRFFTKLEEIKSRYEGNAFHNESFSPFEDHALSVLVSLIQEEADCRNYPFISEHLILEPS